jgi:hypothetical protein
MGTIVGVVPLAEASPTLMEKLAPLGVVAVDSAPTTRRIFIEVDAWTPQPAEDLARRVSKALGIATLALERDEPSAMRLAPRTDGTTPFLRAVEAPPERLGQQRGDSRRGQRAT